MKEWETDIIDFLHVKSWEPFQYHIRDLKDLLTEKQFVIEVNLNRRHERIPESRTRESFRGNRRADG